MSFEVDVSICCITYNHERYIAEAIEGFINQKIDFSIEILIHDDCSTDNTAQIIKAYEIKYPEIIKPIYQTENQQSKGTKIFPLLMSKAKGKYIALCEGDDFWINSMKLQKQFDYMQNHPECSLCVHSTKRLGHRGQSSQIIKASNESREINIQDILYSRDVNFHTSSMFFKSEDVKELPYYHNYTLVTDLPLKLYLMTLGSTFYINSTMSTYRSNLPGSWSDRVQGDKHKAIKHYEDVCKMLEGFNDYTNYEYDKAIRFSILHYEFIILLRTNSYIKMLSKKYKTYRSTFSFKEISTILINIFSSSVYKIFKIKSDEGNNE